MNVHESSDADLQRYISRADLLIEVERWQDARPILLDAMRLAPEDTRVLCRLSLVEYHLGELREAIRFADLSIGFDPECEWAFRLRSLALSALGNHRDAVQAAHEAVRLMPQGREAIYILCVAQRQAGLIMDAKVTARQLLAIAPDWSPTFEALTTVALAAREWADAEEFGCQGLEIDPNSFSMLNNVGVALLEQKRKREAVEFFEAAARLQPDKKIVRSNLRIAVDGYLKLAPVALVIGWILVRFLNVDTTASLVGLVLLGGAVVAVQSYKRRRLSSTVRNFMELEKQSQSLRHGGNGLSGILRLQGRNGFGRIILPLVVVVIVFRVYTDLMSGFLKQISGAWYAWILFPLLALIGIGAVGWSIWISFRNSREDA